MRGWRVPWRAVTLANLSSSRSTRRPAIVTRESYDPSANRPAARKNARWRRGLSGSLAQIDLSITRPGRREFCVAQVRRRRNQLGTTYCQRVDDAPERFYRDVRNVPVPVYMSTRPVACWRGRFLYSPRLKTLTVIRRTPRADQLRDSECLEPTRSIVRGTLRVANHKVGARRERCCQCCTTGDERGAITFS